MTTQNSAATSSAPSGSNATPERLAFFRYGEITLLFRNSKRGDAIPDPNDLRRVLQGEPHKVELAPVPDRHPYQARFHRPNEHREHVLIRDIDDTDLLLLTVNLSSWEPDLEEAARKDQRDRKVLDAARDVPLACARLNANAANISVGNWQLVHATPNWLAVPFCYWDGGGPGGRPIRANFRKCFRPYGYPDAVRDAVLKCVGGTVDDLKDKEVRGEVRIAIIDSWPMENDPKVPCGEAPAQPLEKIRQFVKNNPAARNNSMLQAAARGDLVKPDRFFDYVSCQPPNALPNTQYNWKRKAMEPSFDQADHGLMVAGIIKDIASDAILSVYRVLDNHRIGELPMIVRAVVDAIRHANGHPLIINMSLGIAPPLLLIQGLLDDPQEMQTVAGWTKALRQTAHSDQRYVKDPATDAKRLEKHGLADRGVGKGSVKLLRELALVDDLFRLPQRNNVLVVAAAGNDSNGPDHRFGPRLPAAIEGVFGVSSLRGGDGRMSSFSNRDDIDVSRDDAVAAFGGEIRHIGPQTRTTNGIVGIAITPDLPPHDLDVFGNPVGGAAAAAAAMGGFVRGTNVDGWAEWAGTSFSTAVVSGLAACVWAERGPNASAQSVMQDIAGTPANHKEVDLQQTPI